MKKHSNRRLILNFILTFLSFFILSRAVIELSFIMFFRFNDTAKAPDENFEPLVFFTLLVVSLIFGLAGTIWRIYTVENPSAKSMNPLRKYQRAILQQSLTDEAIHHDILQL